MENKKKTESPVQDNYLHLFYLKAKTGWAQWMSSQSARPAPKVLKGIFLVVTGLFGTFFLMIIVTGGQLFYSKPWMRPDAIQTIRVLGPSITWV